jgi:hypothetical protein
MGIEVDFMVSLVGFSGDPEGVCGGLLPLSLEKRVILSFEGLGGSRSHSSLVFYSDSTTKYSSEGAIEVCSSSCCTLHEHLFLRGRD